MGGTVDENNNVSVYVSAYYQVSCSVGLFVLTIRKSQCVYTCMLIDTMQKEWGKDGHNL